jgi:Glycosyl hydrolases family 2
VTVQDGDGVARLDVDITHGNDEQLTITASVGGVSRTTPVQDGRALLELRVPEVALWWPHTHEDQPLHDLEVELRAAEAPLDRWQRRIGFRTVTPPAQRLPEAGCDLTPAAAGKAGRAQRGLTDTAAAPTARKHRPGRLSRGRGGAHGVTSGPRR